MSDPAEPSATFAGQGDEPLHDGTGTATAAVADGADDPLALNEVGQEEAPGVGRRPKRSAWKEWLIVIVVAGGFALLIRTFVVEQFKVVGQSMEPTLHSGDRVLVNKLGYRFHDPNRGDVVVLEPQKRSTTEDDLIKRIIGLPGETVTMSATDCVVMINGAPLIEPYLSDDAKKNCKGGLDQPVVVPKDHVLVMGDNRGHSYDGRAFGPVSFDEVVGRAFVVIWPKSDWQWL